jgi:hypothetical protein
MESRVSNCRSCGEDLNLGSAISAARTIACLLAIVAAGCGKSAGSETPAAPGVSVSPSAIGLPPRSVQSFAATVTGGGAAVSWLVFEGAGAGTIASTGATTASYTAPSTEGTYHVVARSISDPSLVGTAVVAVAVVPPPPAGCGYGAGFVLQAGPDASTETAAAKPAKGAYFADPHYQTCVVRATNHTAEGYANFLRNDYSRRQAFNANSSKFLSTANNGDWLVYDGSTLAQLKNLTLLGGDAEAQWHPTDPDLLYWVPTAGGTVLNELNVRTDANRVVGSFSGRLPWAGVAHVWTRSEGSPSADDRYWCFMAESASFGELGFFTWDKQTDTILATYTTTQRPDHLSMSPSGNHCVVSWDAGTGPTGTLGQGGVWSFDRDFKNPRQLSRTGEHSDIALLPSGDDAFVSIDYDDGNVYFTNLTTGARTNLFQTYINGHASAMHFSGKGFGRPGWAVVSMYADDLAHAAATVPWPYRKVFIVELAANPRIYMVAHHHSDPYSGNYFDEPHASVSRDFTRITFNSNWDTGTTDVDQYIAFIPVTAFPR